MPPLEAVLAADSASIWTGGLQRRNDDFIEVMEQKKIGTPAYMPPEMATVYNASAHILATKVDVYEAGVTFGYMWSGVPPWNNTEVKFSSQLELLYERIARGERPSIRGGPRRVPEDMVKILDEMQSHVPEDRPTFGEVAKMIMEHMNKTESKNPVFDGSADKTLAVAIRDGRRRPNKLSSGQTVTAMSYSSDASELPRVKSFKGLTL